MTNKDIHEILKENGLKLEGFQRSHDGYMNPVVTDLKTGKPFEVPGEPCHIRFSENLNTPVIAIPRGGGKPYPINEKEEKSGSAKNQTKFRKTEN